MLACCCFTLHFHTITPSGRLQLEKLIALEHFDVCAPSYCTPNAHWNFSLKTRKEKLWLRQHFWPTRTRLHTKRQPWTRKTHCPGPFANKDDFKHTHAQAISCTTPRCQQKYWIGLSVYFVKFRLFIRIGVYKHEVGSNPVRASLASARTPLKPPLARLLE